MTATNGRPDKPGVPRDPEKDVPTDELVRRLQHLGDWQAADRIEALQARADQAALGHAREADRADLSEFLHKRDVDALQKRVAELEGALKPFSDVGEFIAKHHPDPETDENHETATLVRHFRAAYIALTGGKDE